MPGERKDDNGKASRDRIAKLIERTQKCLGTSEFKQITFKNSKFPDELSLLIYLLKKLSTAKYFQDVSIKTSFLVLHDLLKAVSELPHGLSTRDADGKVRELKDTYVHLLMPLVFDGPLKMPEFNFGTDRGGMSTGNVAAHEASSGGDSGTEHDADSHSSSATSEVSKEWNQIFGEDDDESCHDDGHSSVALDHVDIDQMSMFNSSKFSSEEAREKAWRQREYQKKVDEFNRKKQELDLRAAAAARQTNLNYNTNQNRQMDFISKILPINGFSELKII